MTLKQLGRFVAVAEQLSVTRAVARLHPSQPALSAQPAASGATRTSGS